MKLLLATLLFSAAASASPDYARVADLIEKGETHKLVRVLGKGKRWPAELQGIRKACRVEAARALKTDDVFSRRAIRVNAPVGPHSVDNEPRPVNTARLTGRACSDLEKVARAIVALQSNHDR